MFEKWTDTLLGGHFEIALPALAFSQGEKTYSGSGRVSWSQDSGIRIQGETSGAEDLFRVIDSPLPVGQLIPHSSYLSTSGTTIDGWSISGIPVPLDGYHMATGSSHVVWDCATHGLTLKKPLSQSDGTLIHALFGPPPRTWIRSTHTEIRNDMFHDGSSKLDWLLIETSLGRIGARSRSDQWFEAKIELKTATSDPFAILTALGRAFGFVLGRRMFLRGFEHCALGEIIRFLSVTGSPTSTSLLPPIADPANFMHYAEILLAGAFELFLADVGKSIADHLYLCWDTADNAIQTRLAVTSICLEGLLRLASKDREERDLGFTKAERDEVLAWVMGNETKLSPRFVNRVRGFLGTLHHRRPADILQDWRSRKLLAVSEEDIESWKSIRNPAAHARLIGRTKDRAELQDMMTRFGRVQNLMNRIVLQMMGYSGVYTDYSQKNWPPVPFPLAASDSL